MNFERIPSLPLMGNIPQIISRLALSRGNLAEAAGKFFRPNGPMTIRLKIGPKSFLVTQDLDFIDEILKKNPELYPKTNWEHRVLKPLMKNGLILAQGDEWKRRRQIFNPYFNRPYLGNLIEIARSATIKRFDSRWDKTINFSHEMMCIGTDTLIHYFMGDAFMGDLPGEKSIDHYVNIFRKMEKALEKTVVPFPSLKKRFVMESLELVMSPIKKRSSSPPPGSIMEKLFNDFKNDEDVFEEFGTIFGAAATTVHALSWLGDILGKRPDVLEKLFKEIDFFLKNSTYPKVSLEDLEELHYLTATIREGLRLYPPAPLMLRTPKNIIDGEKIQAIIIPIWLLNRNPLFWENPNEFRPERWILTSPEGKTRLKNVDQYIPFGDGQRICIGMRFSMIESRVILIEILRRFILDSKKQKTPPAKTDILTRPSKDIYLNITKRNL